MVSVPVLLQQGVKLFTINKGMHRVTVDCPADLPPVKGDSGKAASGDDQPSLQRLQIFHPGSDVVVGASLSEDGSS